MVLPALLLFYLSWAAFAAENEGPTPLEEMDARESIVGGGMNIGGSFWGYAGTFLAGAVISAALSTCFSKWGERRDVASNTPKQSRSQRRSHFFASRLPSISRLRKKSDVHVHANARAKHGGVAFVPTPSCLKSAESGGTHPGNSHSNVGKKREETLMPEDRAIIINAMDSYVFSELPPHEKNKLVKNLQPFDYSAGEIICRQGDQGDYFYIIKRGIVEVSISSNETNVDKSVPASSVSASQGRETKSNTRHKSTFHQGGTPKTHSRTEVLFNDHYNTSGLGQEEHSLVREHSFPSGLGQDDSLVRSFNKSFEVDESNSRVVKNLVRGDHFGELALLYNCARAATCRAKTDLTLWRIGRRAFRHAMSRAHDPSKEQSQKEMMLETLKKSPFGKLMSDAILSQLAGVFLPVTYRKDEVIVRKGEVGNVFFIVTSGEISIRDIGRGDAQFAALSAGPGTWFGERSLMTDEPRAATVVATSDTVEVSALSRDQFEAKFGSLKSLIKQEEKKTQLVTIPSFANSSLSNDELEKLIKVSTTVSFTPLADIATVGAKIVPALYIIESGRVEIISEKANAVNTLTKGCYFGAETLSAVNISSEMCSSEQYIRAVEDTVCTKLTLKAIEAVIGDISRLGNSLPPISAKLDRTLTLKDLKTHCLLGMGGFGKVWLVQHKKKPSHIYALKVLDKARIIESGADEYVMREKNIMASIEHPLIVNLISAFQDNSSLYMAMEFIQGGELYTRIRCSWDEADGLSDWDAKFYGACIFESLSHLHNRNILFRDLKPENVVIDKYGYCVLIDLGFARVVLDRTHTICGTPQYFSPELVLGKGYNRCVDDWAFGIVLYEMLVGQSPFLQEDMSDQAVFKRIVTSHWAFPNKVDHGIDVSEEAQDIIRSLLEKDPTKRLGHNSSADEEIRCHPWFEGLLDDSKLLQRSERAPWVPSVHGPLDTSHFEEFNENILETAKGGALGLQADQQLLFRGFSGRSLGGHPVRRLSPSCS